MSNPNLDNHKLLNTASTLEVVAGIIWKDDQILISKRQKDDSLGGYWEFPGGKREPDETLEAALIREIKEELDIEISVEKLFVKYETNFNHTPFTLFLFHCFYLVGTPKTIECDEWRWVKQAELPHFKFTPVDDKIINSHLIVNSSSCFANKRLILTKK